MFVMCFFFVLGKCIRLGAIIQLIDDCAVSKVIVEITKEVQKKIYDVLTKSRIMRKHPHSVLFDDGVTLTV